MKITLLMTLLFGLIFISAVGAAEKTPTPQQQRMTDCNQGAHALPCSLTSQGLKPASSASRAAQFL